MTHSTTGALGELSAHQLSQAKEVALALGEGSLGVLVGAGFSRAVGLPTWAELLDRLAFNRFIAETDIGIATTDWRTFRQALSLAFPDELYRAQALADRAHADFDRELWRAMYLPNAAYEGFDADAFRRHVHDTVDYQPTELMRSIVALPGRLERRPDVTVYTLNFDDLLERAAAQILPDGSHTEGPNGVVHRDGITVAHLHGRLASALPPKAEDIVLTAGDFHRARASWQWPYRRLFDLFEQRTVLMVGIGLADPNLLQVLDLVPPGRHFLLHAVDPSMAPGSPSHEGWKLKQQHWEGKVEFITLADWSDQAAFVNAVRVFSAPGGSLWDGGHKRVLEMTRRQDWSKLWEAQIRGKAARLLHNVAELAREKLSMSDSSKVEAGLFVPSGEDDFLDLPFRSDVSAAVATGRFRPGYRRLRANIATPQGVAGMAYARAELLIAERDADLFDNRFDTAMLGTWRTSRTDCAVVACAPVFDWRAGGVPVGVGYVTSSDASDLDQARLGPTNARFLDEVLLGTAMVEVLHLLKRETST